MRVPILRLKDTLLTSIQVDLTDEDALGFQEDLLRMASQIEAKGVVIDITALHVVDSFLARVFTDTADMVRLLGSEVVISGMRPSVALTLTQMGRELIDVETTLNLDQGVQKVQQLIAAREGASVGEEESHDYDSGTHGNQS